MAIIRNDKAYGFNNGLQTLSPQPIIANRAPTTADMAPLMSLWDYKASNLVWILTSVTNNAANWLSLTGGGGSGTFSSLTVTPGPATITGTTNINTSGAATTTIGNVTGATAVAINSGTGGLTSTSTGEISFTSTRNAAAALGFEVNGGTSEGITFQSLQGTGVNGSASILAESAVGGIALIATGSTNASAIDISANAGGIGIASALQTLVTSSQAAISAIELQASNAAGGVQISTGALAATTGLNLVQGAANASLQVGAGAPSHSAPQGTLYLNTTGSSTSTRAYINTNSSTGWAAITTAS